MTTQPQAGSSAGRRQLKAAASASSTASAAVNAMDADSGAEKDAEDLKLHLRHFKGFFMLMAILLIFTLATSPRLDWIFMHKAEAGLRKAKQRKSEIARKISIKRGIPGRTDDNPHHEHAHHHETRIEGFVSKSIHHIAHEVHEVGAELHHVAEEIFKTDEGVSLVGERLFSEEPANDGEMSVRPRSNSPDQQQISHSAKDDIVMAILKELQISVQEIKAEQARCRENRTFV